MNTTDILKKKLVFNNASEIKDLSEGEGAPQNLSILKCNPGKITITPVMKAILLKASTPHSVDELANWFAKENGFSPEMVYPTIRSFAKKMVKFGALAPEGTDFNSAESFCEELERTKRFGNITLQEKVAKNSSVVLYKCTRPADQREYLIKILHRKSERDSFMREFEILSHIPFHPNVRSCFLADVFEDTPYLLLEYIEGTSLSKLVTKSSLAEKLSIGQQMMQGLAHLHHHQVLHGDIHTSNFMVGIGGEVHLVDLGMAYYEHETDIDHGGVPHYMPPERMPDHTLKFSDKRGNYVSEIFQLGICLYYLLSGDYPFQGFLLKNLAHAIKHDPPQPLFTTSYGETIPQRISSVVFRALKKRPEDRYQSVDEMLREWNEAMDLREGDLEMAGEVQIKK